MFRITAPAAHHIFPLMDPLPPLAEQLLGAEINKIPHTLVCEILCHANTMDQLKVRVIELFRAIAVAVSIGIHLKCTF